MVLEEVLAKMPPALILLDDEEESPPSEWVSSSAHGEYEPSPAVGGFAQQAVASAADMGSLSSSVAASPPRVRRQPNVLMEMVKIVLGGVVGIGLAIVAIWWIAKNDPFTLGPIVSKYVPQIVPKQFHAKSDKKDVSEVPPPVDNNPPEKIKPQPPKIVNTPPDITDPGVDTKFENILNPKDPTEKPADPNDPLAVVDPLAPNPNPPAENPPPAEEAKKYSGAELQKELQTAMAALEAYDQRDKEDKPAQQRLAMELFAAAGPVGFVAAQVDPRDADVEAVMPAVKEYLANVTKGKTSLLGYLSALRIDAGDGIVCPGTVKNFKAVGDMFETELELTLRTGPKTLTILSRDNPQDIAEVDERIVVLGAVVRDPKKIKGYRGAAETVILSGYMQKIELQ